MHQLDEKHIKALSSRFSKSKGLGLVIALDKELYKNNAKQQSYLEELTITNVGDKYHSFIKKLFAISNDLNHEYISFQEIQETSDKLNISGLSKRSFQRYFGELENSGLIEVYEIPNLANEETLGNIEGAVRRPKLFIIKSEVKAVSDLDKKIVLSPAQKREINWNADEFFLRNYSEQLLNETPNQKYTQITLTRIYGQVLRDELTDPQRMITAQLSHRTKSGFTEQITVSSFADGGRDLATTDDIKTIENILSIAVENIRKQVDTGLNKKDKTPENIEDEVLKIDNRFILPLSILCKTDGVLDTKQNRQTRWEIIKRWGGTRFEILADPGTEFSRERLNGGDYSETRYLSISEAELLNHGEQVVLDLVGGQGCNKEELEQRHNQLLKDDGYNYVVISLDFKLFDELRKRAGRQIHNKYRGGYPDFSEPITILKAISGLDDLKIPSKGSWHLIVSYLASRMKEKQSLLTDTFDLHVNTKMTSQYRAWLDRFIKNVNFFAKREGVPEITKATEKFAVVMGNFWVSGVQMTVMEKKNRGAAMRRDHFLPVDFKMPGRQAGWNLQIVHLENKERLIKKNKKWIEEISKNPEIKDAFYEYIIKKEGCTADEIAEQMEVLKGEAKILITMDKGREIVTIQQTQKMIEALYEDFNRFLEDGTGLDG